MDFDWISLAGVVVGLLGVLVGAYFSSRALAASREAAAAGKAAAAEAARANQLAEQANKLNADALDHSKSQTERRLELEAGWEHHRAMPDSTKPERRQHYIVCRLVNRGVNLRVRSVVAVGLGGQVVYMMANADRRTRYAPPMDLKGGHEWHGMSHWGEMGTPDSRTLLGATKVVVETECDLVVEAVIPPWQEPDWSALQTRNR